MLHADCRDIFFDLDGTLVDSFPGIEFSARTALAEIRPTCCAPDFRSHIGPPIREIFRRALGEESTEVLDALNAAFRRCYDGGAWMRTVAYPGVAETLTVLRRAGYRCHVLTNKPLLPTRRILQHLDLTPMFDEIIAPESRTPCFRSKVEAALFMRSHLGLTTGQGVVVGDSEDDHAAAETCGYKFIAVAYGYGDVAKKIPLGQHYILAEFKQLTQFLPLRA